jgi:hypothetical protein
LGYIFLGCPEESQEMMLAQLSHLILKFLHFKKMSIVQQLFGFRFAGNISASFAAD